LAQAADADANVNACVYEPTTPTSPLTVQFNTKASTNKGMSNEGKGEVSLTVTESNVTCADVGKISGDDWGFLWIFEPSSWTLTYTITNSPDSGTAQSRWRKYLWGNKGVEMKSSTAGTVICATKSLCTTTEQQWKETTTGTLYFIFQPQYAK
jgi:hypothetical protein